MPDAGLIAALQGGAKLRLVAVCQACEIFHNRQTQIMYVWIFSADSVIYFMLSLLVKEFKIGRHCMGEVRTRV